MSHSFFPHFPSPSLPQSLTFPSSSNIKLTFSHTLSASLLHLLNSLLYSHTPQITIFHSAQGCSSPDHLLVVPGSMIRTPQQCSRCCSTWRRLGLTSGCVCWASPSRRTRQSSTRLGRDWLTSSLTGDMLRVEKSVFSDGFLFVSLYFPVSAFFWFSF